MPEPAPSYTYATGCVCSLCLTERLAQAQAALDVKTRNAREGWAAANAAVDRAIKAEAALDRLATLTVEEVAAVVKVEVKLAPPGTDMDLACHHIAAAVLALVRARVETRDA